MTPFNDLRFKRSSISSAVLVPEESADAYFDANWGLWIPGTERVLKKVDSSVLYMGLKGDNFGGKTQSLYDMVSRRLDKDRKERDENENDPAGSFNEEDKRNLHSMLVYVDGEGVVRSSKDLKEKKEQEAKKKAEEEAKIKAAEAKERMMADPMAIKTELDRYVVSQDEPKLDLAIALCEVYQRSQNPEIVYQPANVLMRGPTGSGKTKLLEALSMIADIPIEILKVGRMVQSGILGTRLEDSLEGLKRKLDGGKSDVVMMNPFVHMFEMKIPSKKEHGPAIVYLDEIDKLCPKGTFNGNAYGDAVQNELISLMDKMEIAGIDTSKILFVGGGAFAGLDKIIEEQRRQTSSVGFASSASSESVASYSRYEEALKEYGMKGELLGRFPVRTELQRLSEDQLYQILTRAESSVLQQTRTFYKEANDMDIKFTPQALKYMAHKAYQSGSGARALDGVVSKVLKPFKAAVKQYRGKEVIINLKVAKEILQ